jgi:hypothetical protein
MSYDGIKAFNMPKCKIGLNIDDIIVNPGTGYGLALWCLTPLSTIFNL